MLTMMPSTKLLCSLIVLLIISTVQTRRRSITCQEPANEQLEIASAFYELYTDPIYSNFTLNNIPCFENKENMPIVSLDKNKIPRKCKSNRRGTSTQICAESEINDRKRHHDITSGQTSCLWKYVQDIDDDRIPRAITKAQCTCLHCHQGTCKHVYSFIPGLKKRCNRVTGMFVYRKYIYKVPVGCVCVQGKKAGALSRGKLRRVMAE